MTIDPDIFAALTGLISALGLAASIGGLTYGVIRFVGYLLAPSDLTRRTLALFENAYAWEQGKDILGCPMSNRLNHKDIPVRVYPEGKTYVIGFGQTRSNVMQRVGWLDARRLRAACRKLFATFDLAQINYVLNTLPADDDLRRNCKGG